MLLDLDRNLIESPIISVKPTMSALYRVNPRSIWRKLSLGSIDIVFQERSHIPKTDHKSFSIANGRNHEVRPYSRLYWRFGRDRVSKFAGWFYLPMHLFMRFMSYELNIRNIEYSEGTDQRIQWNSKFHKRRALLKTSPRKFQLSRLEL